MSKLNMPISMIRIRHVGFDIYYSHSKCLSIGQISKPIYTLSYRDNCFNPQMVWMNDILESRPDCSMELYVSDVSTFGRFDGI
jgi:hypothetical protein